VTRIRNFIADWWDGQFPPAGAEEWAITVIVLTAGYVFFVWMFRQ
jgi:hypothetical protein